MPNGAILNDMLVDDFQSVSEELGGQTVLGRDLRSSQDLREAIRDGFPPGVIVTVMRAVDLTLDELASSLNLSPRSLQRRKGSHLSSHESDLIYRLARTMALAERYIGDHDKAVRWLKRSNRALGGGTPLESLDTELGARTVENILGRIAYGGVS